MSVVGYVVCGKQQWESRSKASGDLLAGGAECLDRVIENVPAAANLVSASLLLTYLHTCPHVISDLPCLGRVFVKSGSMVDANLLDPQHEAGFSINCFMPLAL